jgi:hypothetical protein
MARIHGNSGEWPKSEARKKFYAILSISLTAMAIYSAFLGFIIAKSRNVWSWVALAAAGLMIPYVLRLMDVPIRKLGRERIKFFRGAQSEAFVGWILQELPDDWHVFHGIQIEEACDIDHIVVGPGGLYLISTKGFRGLFSLSPDGKLLKNNEPSTLLEQTFMQAMNLKDRLKFGMGRDVPFVTAVLAVPLAYVAFSGPQRNVWVLHQDDLTDTLEKAPKRMDKREVERCVVALEMLEKSARQIYRQTPGSKSAAG